MTENDMSAGNAFANASNGAAINGSRLNGHDEDSGPSKRRRVAGGAFTPTWAPCVQAETSLEVDIMMLDYIAYQATKSCLESRKPLQTGTHAPSTRSIGRDLQLADSFTSIFKARHPRYRPDAELRLRLLLLKTTTLFTNRLTLNPTTPGKAALQSLRRTNRQRAQDWISRAHDRLPPSGRPPSAFADVAPVMHDRLERNRAHVLHRLGVSAEDEDYEDAFYGTSSCLSLLDILPFFIEVSAASSNIHNNSLTQRWMDLACEFMLQACLEQYLICGATGLDVLDEAFVWGYLEEGDDAAPALTSRQADINDMFEDDEFATEVEGWRTLKQEYIVELTNLEHSQHHLGDGSVEPDLTSHLEAVAAKHPIDTFEASILKFLEALSLSIAEPVLVQLERGKLDGMTKEETSEFLAQCGVEPLLL